MAQCRALSVRIRQKSLFTVVPVAATVPPERPVPLGQRVRRGLRVRPALGRLVPLGFRERPDLALAPLERQDRQGLEARLEPRVPLVQASPERLGSLGQPARLAQRERPELVSPVQRAQLERRVSVRPERQAQQALLASVRLVLRAPPDPQVLGRRARPARSEPLA